MRAIIVEGARGTGKSTVSRSIRQKISEITLVNPTGYHLDGEDGLYKIERYYQVWLGLISSLEFHDSTFVFDRFFFTEMIFSKLYKSYDFRIFYKIALERLLDEEDNDVTVLFFTISDENELAERLKRDKVPFGKAEESVKETLRQQELYRELFDDAIHNYGLNVIEIDTTGKTPEQVEEEVFKIINKEE